MEDQQATYPTSPRHRSTVKQSIIGIASEHAQPWTATRCHRLLRPLLTHIAALRKIKERRHLTRTPATTAQTAKPRRTVLGKRSYPGSDSDYSDKKTCRKYSRKASRRRAASDQACTPQRNVQRQCRQPSNKGSHDVMLATPFLRRVRNHQLSSPARAPYDTRDDEAEPVSANSRCTHSGSGCKSRCAYDTSLAALRSTIDAERHGLFESVFKAFDALLRVTSPRKNQAAHPKSLLAMCLRKVPACIARLEEWERQECEENGTKSAVRGAGVSFEIYSELESLGAIDGWNNLCLLVRAHAVKIIEDAAIEGLLDDPVTGLLIRVCLEYMPPTEFDGLIRTFVVRQYPKPSSADDDLFTSPAHQPLRILKSCDPAGISLLPRILAELLADGLLPADWILNRSFIALWPSAVRHVTHTKPCQDILDFAITTLELLCDLAAPRRPRGVPQTRLRGKPQTTLISALAALGSVVLLSEEGPWQTIDAPLESSTTRTANLRRRMDYITTTCSTHLKPRKLPTRKLGTYLLALCSFLSTSDVAAPFNPEAQPSSAPSATVLAKAWKPTKIGHNNDNNSRKNNPTLMLQYDATVTLMSAMAHHCGRGSAGSSPSLSPHAYLDRFCDKLETLLSEQQQQGQAAAPVSGMRVDGAFRLAELTGDLRDLEIAEGLLRARQEQQQQQQQQQQQEEEQQGSAVGACSTPGKRRTSSGKGEGKKMASFLGIRWDEGISEWVAATPVTESRPRHQVWGDGNGRRSRLRGLPTDEDSEEEQEETNYSDSEADAETDEVDDSHPEVSSVGNADDDNESNESSAVFDTEDEGYMLTPNTEASPFASVSEPEAKPTHQHIGNGDDKTTNLNPVADDDAIAVDTKGLSFPPPANGSSSSLLAVRPRRLWRPITRAGDELALDTTTTTTTTTAHKKDEEEEEEEGNWLRRKKPARFRPSPVNNSVTVTKKRSARASLVYLQPSRLWSMGEEEKRKRRRTLDAGFLRHDNVTGDSDDELSLL
ncbi:hypothetical protein VTI28DRAFT_9624 [Corynascus sepedonium]